MPKIELTKNEMMVAWNALSEIGEERQNVKFAYLVAQNKNRMRDEIYALEEARKPSKAFMDYDQERVKLAKIHSKKDPKGMPIIVEGNFQFEDLAAWDKVYQELREKHKAAIDEYANKLVEYDELLKEKVEFAPVMIPIDLFPQVQKPNLLSKILFLIKDKAEGT